MRGSTDRAYNLAIVAVAFVGAFLPASSSLDLLLSLPSPYILQQQRQQQQHPVTVHRSHRGAVWSRVYAPGVCTPEECLHSASSGRRSRGFLGVPQSPNGRWIGINTLGLQGETSITMENIRHITTSCCLLEAYGPL